ncbi:hypothetical protein HYALB_00000107 [Hymenoscyphus albidus]|uniref:Uncharacterized protein n=1 Tax=Hymenoscyphus albidus TaxID=595503 RepID=A0A9N9LJ89_9HELO|nr:hypothetical protein HYALB_00000107 [Hymenoscyphus albidus]
MAFSPAPSAVRVIVVTAVFTCFSFAFVGLRLVSRFGFTKSGKRDEIAIVGSLFAAIAVLVLTVRGVLLTRTKRCVRKKWLT